MWLLDTSTIELHSFFGNKIPPYAILSHVWDVEEVSFQDLQGPRTKIQDFAGYKKILRCCAQAVSDGFQWAWIDTCCIDKTNSAELSEAINSMWKWYQESIECYAYLIDVQDSADFSKSKWFTRGWTLQELIAPVSVVFFNQHWEEIGTKRSLKKEVSAASGVPGSVLIFATGDTFSIAQKMSWASNRETTRVEDIAYSLLGLFQVHMPMIYGEGENAFIRLQHEIMKSSNDHSLFAWSSSPEKINQTRGPLALSPAEFAGCKDIERRANDEISEYSMTNIGLQIELPVASSNEPRIVLAYLACGEDDGTIIGIRLYHLYRNVYMRVEGKNPVKTKNGNVESRKEMLYIEQPRSISWGTSWMSPQNMSSIKFSYDKLAMFDFILVDKAIWGAFNRVFDQWTVQPGSLHLHPPALYAHYYAGILLKHEKMGNQFAVIVGRSEGGFFSDIETEINPMEDMDAVVASYSSMSNAEYSKLYNYGLHLRKRRRDSVQDRLDRVTRSLPGSTLLIKLAVRKTLTAGERAYTVRITIS